MTTTPEPNADCGLPRSGDFHGPCPTCDSHETHVSYEDPSANYCRTCGAYWRDAAPEGAVLRAVIDRVARLCAQGHLDCTECPATSDIPPGATAGGEGK